MRLYCETGEHHWEKTGRGRPPKSCPEHRNRAVIAINKAIEDSLPDIEKFENELSDFVPVEAVPIGSVPHILLSVGGSSVDIESVIERGKKLLSTRELYCHGGDHVWQAERKRGKPPRNCPQHAVTGSIERKVELDSEKKKKAQMELQDQIARLSARVGEASERNKEHYGALRSRGGASKADDETFKQWLRANSALLGSVEALRARERKLMECC